MPILPKALSKFLPRSFLDVPLVFRKQFTSTNLSKGINKNICSISWGWDRWLKMCAL